MQNGTNKSELKYMSNKTKRNSKQVKKCLKVKGIWELCKSHFCRLGSD